MSGRLPGADVRGFYHALGIELPEWAKREAPVGCFANPGAHAHGDRDPSCSVNLESGAWHCWGCGAKGGAFDAALACGLRPPVAIDLMVAHGLTARRGGPALSRGRIARDSGGGPMRAGDSPRRVRAGLAVDERRLAEASARLSALSWPPRVLREEQARVWSRAALLELGCGFERGLVLIPIRSRDGELRGLLRYAPSHDWVPKVVAVRGTRLGLIPHPCTESSTWVVLVEGPPDVISARSRGLPAIAVPGDDAWQRDWAQLLVGRYVSIVFDCDRAGRDAAARIAADLKAAGVRGSVVDLARGRTDGYDLTEWLAERDGLPAQELCRALGAPGSGPRAGAAGGSWVMT